jgi:hypothetical protein
MNFLTWISNRICKDSLGKGQPSPEFKNVSAVEEEMLERAIELEEKRHQLDTKKAMDRVQLAFSRILMAAAVLTLTLILISSFDIPSVSVNPEVVKLMIDAVIVELAGIATLGFMRHFKKEE